MNKRFKVALSFPGEKREFIKEVAEHLSFALGKEKVFYDDYYIDELARPNLDVYLMNIYKDQSELVAFFLCEDYTKKEWCGLEWRAVRDMIKHKQDDDLMPFRFDQFPVEGSLSIDGYADVKNKSAKDTSELILKRLRRNEGIIAGKNQVLYDNALTKLQSLEKEIEELKSGKQTPEVSSQIQTLTHEKEELRQQLLGKDEIIARQENTQKELEASLAAEQGKGELKQQALIAIEKKDYDTAEELLKEAAEERMKQVAEDFYQLGTVKELKLEYTEALKYYELAAKIPPYNTDYLRKAADLCQTFGLISLAVQYLEQAIALDKKQHGDDSDQVAHNYNNISLVLQDAGELDKSIEYLEKALKTALHIYGSEHGNIATCYNNLALVWRQKKDYDKAISYSEKALDIGIKIFGEKSSNIAIYYNNLGLVFLDKCDWDEAINEFEKALKITLELSTEESPALATYYNNWGLGLQGKGDLDKAIECYEKALNIGIKLFGEINPATAIRYNNLGNAWYEKDNLQKAIEFTQKSYDILLKLYGADNPSTQIIKANMDLYLSEKGE